MMPKLVQLNIKIKISISLSIYKPIDIAKIIINIKYAKIKHYNNALFAFLN